MNEPHDDLADLLSPSAAASRPAFRDSLLRQTERRLARGRLLRHGTRAVAMASIFAAGGLAGWLARPERERTIELPGAVHTVVVPVPLPVPERSHNVLAASPTSASTAELAAEQQDDPNAAAKLYREAGDAFLRDQDYPNATRCYRLYLARAGEAALALETNDSWLLVSLKNAAFREKIDVTQNDG
jgi:hypothetical protein